MPVDDATPGSDIVHEMAMRPVRVFEFLVTYHSALLDRLSDTNQADTPYWCEWEQNDA